MSERGLPSNLEAERSVLGAVLLHNHSINIAIEVIEAKDFFRDAHKRIFEQMVHLSQRSESIDLVTLKESLGRVGELDNVGGPSYISALIDGVPRSTNVEHYARIIREKSLLRNVIILARDTSIKAYDGEQEPELIIDTAFSELLTLSTRATGPGLRRVDAMIPGVWDRFEALARPDSKAWGHRSGIFPLDRMLRGFRPGKVVMIAARPGGGKTSLALNIAKAVAKVAKEPVAYFTLEMTEEEIMDSLVSSEARVNIEDVADDKLTGDDWTRVAQAVTTIEPLPLYIDEHTDLSPITLRAKLRRLQIEQGLSMAVIDYVQLMQGLPTNKRNETENDRLTGISRAIKLLAKDLKVPIVLLSQLSRAPESRNDGRPGLADLRGSGSLEQDADSVMVIHDPSKFSQRRKKSMKTSDIVREEVERGVVELIFLKNRGLKTGTVKVMFRPEYVTFENLQL